MTELLKTIRERKSVRTFDGKDILYEGAPEKRMGSLETQSI